jgi:hypothetical protein
MKELLRCGTDVDRHGSPSFTCHFDQEHAQAQRVVVGEALQDKTRFLFDQDSHEFFRALQGHRLNQLSAPG